MHVMSLRRFAVCWVVALVALLGRNRAAHAQGPAYLVTDIKPGAGSFADLGGSLLFFQGLDLWKSDGTATGTRLVAAVGGGCGVGEETTANGLLFFNLGCYGGSLWRSDGTAAGTFQLLSSAAGDAPPPTTLVNLNDTLFFYAVVPTAGIWKSDGTVAGTQPAVLGVGRTFLPLAVAAGQLFFAGQDDITSQSGLWVTDGTAAGTRFLVKEGDAEALTAVNARLFFTAFDYSGSRGLWVTDGTAAGTVLVKTPVPLVEDIRAADGRLFFVSDGTLWTSDGTASGTMALKLFAGTDGRGPLTAVGRHVFFSANDEAHGYELWKSDGTLSGTVLVKDINPGGAGSNPSSLTDVRGTLFFSADDGSSGREPWKSDGTEAGTLRVQDIWPGDGSSDPMSFTASGSHVFFTANDSHGLALWALPLPATITVNSAADNTSAGDRKCTLREAIANVNAAVDTTGGDCAPGTGRGDTIAFDLPRPATITLTTNSELAVNRDVTISGPTAGLVAVDGNQATRVFDITAGAVRIANLTIQNGRTDHGGGIAVASSASVTLADCTLSGNSTSGRGGGLDNAGTAIMTNCTLNGNSATLGVDGGGIFNTGFATLANCTLSGNSAYYYGGGIAVDSGSVMLTDCTLSGNAASGGGGILIARGASVTLANCTLSANRVDNSFRLEAFFYGGGIDNAGDATLTNVTISGNTAQDGGGGVINAGNATLTNVTISANTAGDAGGSGIYSMGGTVSLKDTIVANPGINCAGGLVSQGHNLSSDGTCGFTAAGDLDNTDPKLGPLRNNSGPTLTQALLLGSPAIDAGGPDCPPTDQRGVTRPRGAACDIGAYEVVPAGQGGAFTVNSTADAPDAHPGDGVCASADGTCTLRAAIDEANAGPGGSVINVPAGTYPGGLAITMSLTLSGAGVTATRIDGSADGGGPVVHVDSGAVVDVRDVVIQNGEGFGGYGGGFANEGDVTLTNVTVSDNTNMSGGSAPTFGGGFSNYFNFGGPPAHATLINVTIRDNRLYNGHPTPAWGGGIYNQAGAVLALINSTVSGNTAETGFNDNSLGGGLYNAGNATLTNVTISGNTAGNGRGIANTGSATLTNVTISANAAGDLGGSGIDSTGGKVLLTNTIVANPGTNCAGTLVSQGHSLSSDGSCGFTGAGDLGNVDPLLGPLQDNGGPTFTQALPPGSPAIDAGDDAVTGPPLNLLTDQRGLPRKAGLHVDIGAVESGTTSCVGDCGYDGKVTVDELVLMVNIALGNTSVSECAAGDGNQDAKITVDELVRAVANALNGCPPP